MAPVSVYRTEDWCMPRMGNQPHDPSRMWRLRLSSKHGLDADRHEGLCRRPLQRQIREKNIRARPTFRGCYELRKCAREVRTNMYDIKSMVSGNKKVRFTQYRHKHLYYVTECGFEFPVPIEDIGDAITRIVSRRKE